MKAAPNRAPSVRAVAVCYHMKPDRFIERLDSLAADAGIRLRGVVVNNQPEHASLPHVGAFQVVQGTNHHLDFSGYFEGLQHLLVIGDSDASNVLFMNDSLLTAHSSSAIFRRVIALDRLLQQLEVPAGVGKLDPYRSICLRNPWSGHGSYLSTFCFLLNRSAQPILRRLIADAETDGVLSEAPLEDLNWGAGLTPLMREYIRAHLVYDGSPYRWRAAAPEPELIRKKAQCVYFEHRLSGSLGLEGALVPINAGPRSRLAVTSAETATRLLRSLKGQAA